MLIVVLLRCWVTPSNNKQGRCRLLLSSVSTRGVNENLRTFRNDHIVQNFSHLFRRCSFSVKTYKIAAFSQYYCENFEILLTALVSTSTLSTTHIAALLSHVLRRTDGFHVCESGKLSRQTPAVRIQSLNIHYSV